MVFEDNDATIKTIIKGRSVTLRHCARTHRVDLDWLWERIREDPGVFMKYINTKVQLADMLTKGSFTAHQWLTLCTLGQVGPAFASANKPTSTAQVKPPKKRKSIPVAQFCFGSDTCCTVSSAIPSRSTHTQAPAMDQTPSEA